MSRARFRTALGLALALSLAGCSSHLVVQESSASEPTTLPRARVFLVGDGGVTTFREAEVEEQAERAEKRVETKRALPPWARPPGGEKKVFREIVDEAIGLAVQNAHPVRLLQTLKGDAQNRERLAPGAVPLIVWLGDNVYEHGVPRDPGEYGYKDGALTPAGLEYVEAAAALVVQAQVAVEARANGVFIPGNHDWDRDVVSSGPEGRERVIESGEVLRRYVDERRTHGALSDGLQVRVLPSGGCPGPATVDVPITADTHVRIAAVDTEWLIADDPDRGCASGGRCRPCDPGTREGVYAALQAITEKTRPGDALIVVGHHPVQNYGMHGAQVFWNDPKSWFRWAPLSPEDSPHPRYRHMRNGLVSAFDAARGQPLLYAGGHDHNLQLIRMPSGPYVAVSGSASKKDPVRAGRGTRFAHSEHGYMVVDFFEDGRVLLYVVEVPDGDAAVQRFTPFELRAARKAAAGQSVGVEPAQ